MFPLLDASEAGGVLNSEIAFSGKTKTSVKISKISKFIHER